ncbi:MAG: hypothetical protein V4511_02450 [Bacteroidota bacterium]
MSSSAHLNIPLSFNQIIDLIKQLPKTQQEKLVLLIQKQEDFDVPEWHKKIVLDRIKKEKLNEGIPWKEARKKLKFKTK